MVGRNSLESVSVKQSTRKRRGAKERLFRFDVWQEGQIVASGEGPETVAKAEGFRYASVYAQDGPVLLKFTPVKKPASRRINDDSK